MAPSEVIEIVGSDPSHVIGDRWIYRGVRGGGRDMVSDLEVRFKDGVVERAYLSWTSIHHMLRK